MPGAPSSRHRETKIGRSFLFHGRRISGHIRGDAAAPGRTVFYLVFVGGLLFVSAGTLAWPAAWIYLALTAVVSIGGGLWLAGHDPALLAERLKPMIQREQKPWDKLFMSILLALWCGWLVLMGSMPGASIGRACRSAAKSSASG